MQRFYLLLFIVVIIALGVFMFLYFAYESDDKSLSDRLVNLRKLGDSSVGLEEDKIQSYYNLDRFKIFTNFSEKGSAYISARISLAYPYNSYDTEKEIIYRRDQIRSLVQRYISTKTYRELDTAQKKEELKIELLYRINKLMEHSISDIYYVEFMVLPQN